MSMFVIIEHSTETPVQKAGLNYPFKTYKGTVEALISSLKDNCELECDGTNGGYEIHVPDSDENLEHETEIRDAMKKARSLVVDHGDYEVRYDIVELLP